MIAQARGDPVASAGRRVHADVVVAGDHAGAADVHADARQQTEVVERGRDPHVPLVGAEREDVVDRAGPPLALCVRDQRAERTADRVLVDGVHRCQQAARDPQRPGLGIGVGVAPAVVVGDRALAVAAGDLRGAEADRACERECEHVRAFWALHGSQARASAGRQLWDLRPTSVRAAVPPLDGDSTAIAPGDL
jgi:hypothetical protein